MTDEIKTPTITASTRYSVLHREKILQAKKEKYNSNPTVIAKREERERRRQEKEAEKETKRLEKEHIRQQRIKYAEETKRT